MRFPSLEALRASPIYKTLASLQKMPVFRQHRFIEVFNRLWTLATKQGAASDVADAHATAIALMAAERYTPTPAMATLEAEEHFFATMAEFQYSEGGTVEINDFSFVLANLDMVNAAVTGNAFNLSHEHTEPTGVVRRLAKPEDVPAEVRAKFPESPFFTVASYYEGTPDSIRAIETVSAEWLQSKAAADGSRKVILPDTFALTANPATPIVLGVGKAAAAGVDEKSFEARQTVEGTRDSMPPTVQELEAKVAALQKEADNAKEAKTALADLQTKHDDLVAKMAALAGKPADKDTVPDEDQVLKDVQSKLASLETSIIKLHKDAEQKAAELWADGVVKAKEIAMDAKPKLAALYMSAKEAAIGAVAALPDRAMQPGSTDANLNVEKLSEEDAKKAQAFLKEAFG